MDLRQLAPFTRETNLREVQDQEMKELQAHLHTLQSAYADSSPVFQLLALASQAVDLARRLVESEADEWLQEVQMIRVQVADITCNLEEAELYAQLT
jgi:hypothetical protein